MVGKHASCTFPPDSLKRPCMLIKPSKPDIHQGGGLADVSWSVQLV